MRKLLMVITILVFVAPAMAGTVILRLNQDANDYSARRVEVYYTADANVSGFGLNITVTTADANIIEVNNYHVGESVTGNKGFGIFPMSVKRFIDVNNPNWSDSNYTPIAASGDRGASGTGLGTGTVILEMGALYEDGNQPSTGGLLCTFRIDNNDCNVAVSGDSTRGNVVMEDATEASLTGDEIIVLGDDPGGHVYPDCWGYSGTGYKTQCHADCDGDGEVGLLDFYEFRDSWNKTYPDPCYLAHPCADTTRDGEVGLLDFYDFRDNWNKFPDPNCTAGDPCDVYKP